ncbi:MAG: transposase domain-containing protein [Propionivibrio sp.]|nr:transposase domain-containing protein [Propionivibrio sp.]
MDPCAYLVSLFRKLPTAQTADDYDAPLPWQLAQPAT